MCRIAVVTAAVVTAQLSIGVTDQPQYPRLSCSRTLPARSLSRSPSSSPSPFTQYPSSPRSLVRDGQTSSHWPRLVVSRSTCPHFPPKPAREQLCNRYCSNKHTHLDVSTENLRMYQTTCMNQQNRDVKHVYLCWK